MTKRALISVSDKSGIVEFAQELKKLGWDIISTGGTKVALDNAGVDTIAIDDVTGFPEMMDGRVKTLHPNIHGGLLARRDLDSHLEAANDNQIELIDLVVVNLYPFKETILKPDVTYAEAVENIDIGGPSMLRSAAKNHASVTVVVDPADYAVVLDELSAAGETSYETRQRLAAKVFRHTAAYDALIAEYFTAQVGESKPEKLTLTYDLKQAMRYGENPQQDADFYQKALPTDYSIASAKQLNGKELSFNNIRDADAAIRIIRDFKDRPTVVALKHMNPCGIGQADDIETAWDYAYESDPVSIFGGIVVLNREVDAATAEKMHGVFLEIIIAPSYTDEAIAILTNKKFGASENSCTVHFLSCRSIYFTVENDNTTKDRHWIRLISVVPSSFDIVSLTNPTWVHVFKSHNGWTVFEITDNPDSGISVTDIVEGQFFPVQLFS